MISSILTLLILLAIFIAGLMITSFFSEISKIERIGLSILLGSVGVTYSFFCLHAFVGIPITVNLLVLTFLIFFSLLALLKLIQRKFKPKSVLECSNVPQLSKQTSYSEKILVIGILLLLLHSLLRNLFWPLHGVFDWDALALYDFRAIVLTQSGSFKDGIERGYFLQYPPFTSLLHTFFYLVQYEHAKVWYTVIYGSMICIFYSIMRRERSRTHSLLAAFMLAISSYIFAHSGMAYTNLAYSGFIGLGYLYVFQWIRHKQSEFIILGSCLIASGTWVRLIEPYWLVALLAIPLGWLIHKKISLSSIFGILLILFLKYPWLHFVDSNSGVKNVHLLSLSYGVSFGGSLPSLFSRMHEVLFFLYQSVYIQIFKVFTPALLLSILSIIVSRQWKKLIDFLLFAVLILFLIVGTFIFSFQYPGWYEIPGSTTRMSILYIPIIIYLVFLAELFSCESTSFTIIKLWKLIRKKFFTTGKEHI